MVSDSFQCNCGRWDRKAFCFDGFDSRCFRAPCWLFSGINATAQMEMYLGQ